jgi:hypothetical protein
MMDDLIKKLRLLAKAEAILVRLHLRRAVMQVSLVMAAALFGLLALAMLNVALYLLLAPRLDPAMAAFVVAGADLLVAVLAVVAAGRLEIGHEATEAESIRNAAMQELTADAERMRTKLEVLGDDIRDIRTTVSGILRPGGINIPAIFQWLMTIVGFLRRKGT